MAQGWERVGAVTGESRETLGPVAMAAWVTEESEALTTYAAVADGAMAIAFIECPELTATPPVRPPESVSA